MRYSPKKKKKNLHVNNRLAKKQCARRKKRRRGMKENMGSSLKRLTETNEVKKKNKKNEGRHNGQ